MQKQVLFYLKVRNYEGRPGVVQFKSDGVKRIYDFAEWLFTQNESHIICGGHSIYFRKFNIFYCSFFLAQETLTDLRFARTLVQFNLEFLPVPGCKILHCTATACPTCRDNKGMTEFSDVESSSSSESDEDSTSGYCATIDMKAILAKRKSDKKNRKAERKRN